MFDRAHEKLVERAHYAAKVSSLLAMLLERPLLRVERAALLEVFLDPF